MPERSDTPVTFSRQEIAEIRAMLTKGEDPLTCPRCEGELSMEQPDVAELKRHIYLKCRGCHRTAFISREPPQRKFDLYE